MDGGVVIRQTDILNMIEAHPGLTNIELGDFFKVTYQEIGTRLSRLSRQGYIHNKGDGWHINSSIVPKRTPHPRNLILLEIDGRTQCMADWCREFKMPYSTVMSRIRRHGWSALDAVTVPIGRKRGEE